MPLVINAPDALRKSVESASGGRNTVIYTDQGQPCMMFVLPKFTLESIDASLGTGTHPAFIINSVEKDEIFIGQFSGVSLNTEMISQPGRAVTHTLTHDQAVNLARANGTGWHAMTNVEWAAIMLRCWKDGWQPRGNTDYGRSSDLTTEYGVQENGRVITTGSAGGGGRTLTGSGPATWRHNRNPFGIADLGGNVWEWAPGLRLNAGEINIIANNNAAMQATDFGAASAAWRAVDGATGALVAPGTAGTVKLAGSGTANYTLVLTSGGAFQAMTNPGSTPVGTAALRLLKAHGIVPIAASGLGVDTLLYTATDERMVARGGVWVGSALGGVNSADLRNLRTAAIDSVGCRVAYSL